MYTITVKTGQDVRTVSCEAPTLLSTAIQGERLPIHMPCGGAGRCGKCLVRAEGALSPLTKEEEKTLTPEELRDGWRLACCAKALGDVTVYYSTEKTAIQGISFGKMPAFRKNPLSGDRECYGMAVDIGTTTVAAYLYRFPDCVCLEKRCVPNRQASHGSDVISRIEYSNQGGLSTLQALILEDLETLRNGFGVPIAKTVITGNTTMLHLLQGLDPHDIAVSPFLPKSLFGEWDGDIYLAPCISAYVGADITTAILASDMEKDSCSLLIDVGTNGEMAIWKDGRLACCSTAAGPAFEGAGISQGTMAIDGALSEVWVEDGAIRYKTIGDAAPVGVCGTGLLDAIACMLELEVIDSSGYLEEDWEIGDSGIYITAEDVRQVQLAKAAICAGIETLADTCGVGCEEIETVYLAGGFGSYLRPASCGRIGMIPEVLVDKIQVIGNGAGIGASMILQSTDCLERATQIASGAESIELSASEVFMDKYMERMFFGDLDD